MPKVPQQASPRHSAAPTAPEPPRLTIHETIEERDTRVRQLVAEALAAQPAPPKYVDDRTCAQAFDTSPQTIARLASQGAPHVVLGDRRRWNIAELADWLRARAHAEAAE